MTSIWPKHCDVPFFWRINVVFVYSVHYYLVLTRFFKQSILAWREYICSVGAFFNLPLGKNVILSTKSIFRLDVREVETKKNKRKSRKSKWVRIFEYCATFFRWCCLTTSDQVSMTPVPLISPIHFYLKVFTCAVLGKESVFIFLVVRTTKRPQARWVSSLWSWAHLKRASTALECQTTLMIMFPLTCLSSPLVSAPLNSDIYNQFELRL